MPPLCPTFEVKGNLLYLHLTAGALHSIGVKNLDDGKYSYVDILIPDILKVHDPLLWQNGLSNNCFSLFPYIICQKVSL